MIFDLFGRRVPRTTPATGSNPPMAPYSWPHPDPNAEARAKGRRAAELEHEGKVRELEAEVARLREHQNARVISELRALAAQMWALRDTRNPDRSAAWNDGVGGCAVMASDRVQELKGGGES